MPPKAQLPKLASMGDGIKASFLFATACRKYRVVGVEKLSKASFSQLLKTIRKVFFDSFSTVGSVGFNYKMQASYFFAEALSLLLPL